MKHSQFSGPIEPVNQTAGHPPAGVPHRGIGQHGGNRGILLGTLSCKGSIQELKAMGKCSICYL